MKQLFTLFLALGLGMAGMQAQNCAVSGIVRDGLSGDPLIGAYVKVGDKITATDIDGRYTLSIPTGNRELTFSYIGYAPRVMSVNITGTSQTVNARLESLIMEEAIVAADLAIDRKTPVAFTNVLPAQIQEELAGRDLPLILNGVMDPRTTAHGPNESLHLGIFAKAVAANVHLLAELAALGKAGVKG